MTSVLRDISTYLTDFYHELADLEQIVQVENNKRKVASKKCMMREIKMTQTPKKLVKRCCVNILPVTEKRGCLTSKWEGPYTVLGNSLSIQKKCFIRHVALARWTLAEEESGQDGWTRGPEIPRVADPDRHGQQQLEVPGLDPSQRKELI